MVFVLVLALAFSSQGKADWFGNSIPIAPKPIISREWHGLIYDELVLQSPVGKMIGGVVPKSYEEMVHEGHDAPISIIQSQHISSRDYWKKQKSKKNSQSLILLKMDSETFSELNLRAAEVWDHLIECNGNNPEAARRAFFEFQKLCSDPGQGKEVSGQLKELAQNYQQFLISTPIIDFSDLAPHDSSPPVVEAFGKGIHPLIAQFAINQWAVFLNHPAENTTPISWAISEVIGRLKENALYLRLQSEILRSTVRPLNTGEETILRVVINNLIVLTLLNGEHLQHPCGIYGLWPAMNRVLFRWEALLGGGIGAALYNELTSLDKTAQTYCGKSVRYIDFGVGTEGIYGSSGVQHINNLRILYQFYVGVTWEKRVEK